MVENVCNLAEFIYISFNTKILIRHENFKNIWRYCSFNVTRFFILFNLTLYLLNLNCTRFAVANENENKYNPEQNSRDWPHHIRHPFLFYCLYLWVCFPPKTDKNYPVPIGLCFRSGDSSHGSGVWKPVKTHLENCRVWSMEEGGMVPGFSSMCLSPLFNGCGRRKIRLIETNAKCRHLKKLTCKGTLRHVFICLRPKTPNSPPYTLFSVYVYTVYF